MNLDLYSHNSCPHVLQNLNIYHHSGVNTSETNVITDVIAQH